MKNYQSFKVEDFLADDYFLNWVLSGGEKHNNFWEEWLEKHPSKRSEVEKAITIVKALTNKREEGLNPFQKEKLLDRVNARIDSLERDDKPAITLGRKFYYASAVAACFVIVAFLGYFFVNNVQQTTINTDYAEVKEMILPDGSSVMLNANSEITYAKDWSEQTSREIWLEGEAFFEVVKIKQADSLFKPFIVHAGNLDVEVLGTSFNLGERRGETKVTLLTGKVKLENKLDKSAPPLFLEPGEHAEISTGNKVLKKSKVDTRKYASWVEGVLIFDGAELLEIKHVLQDNFGLEVVFEDAELGKRKFTGVIKTENVEEFLKTLELSFDIDVTKKDRKVIFSD